ncbi:amidase [Planosporangium sp. 12N6]|uniref:amidase n=1 Tax=Planosporangium spinosum TaxID=3402278 RepID=UPI003CF80F8A
MSDDRFTLPLARRRELVETGALDPHAYRRDLVEHIRDADPAVRAFVDWRPGDVAASGVPWAPSVTYKDTIDVAGYPTRLGIRSGYRRYPRASAEIARRLAAVGLGCAGKVATTECALGSVKPSRNPRYPHVSPAGSSTGSAVAVAAGFCDLSVGTDSGGSLRWPAVYCGVTSLRVTPRPELLAGVHTVAPSLESVGFVARTAADLAWCWRTYGLGAVVGARAVRPSGRLRVAVTRPPGETLHPEVGALLDRVRDALAGSHHAVTEADLPEVWRLRAPAGELLAREAHDSFAELAADPGVELGPDTRAAIDRGTAVTDPRYRWLRALQADARVRLALLLRRAYDLLIMPLEADLPDSADARPASTLPEPGGGAMTLVANLAGLPVLAQPLAMSTQDSPLGVQVLAAPGADDLLVAAAELLAGLDLPVLAGSPETGR